MTVLADQTVVGANVLTTNNMQDKKKELSARKALFLYKLLFILT